MFNTRTITFIIALTFIGLVGFGLTFIARGYRFNLENGKFKPTGLLVATSNPNGASILVNGVLESATNATITLAPDTYDVQIKKEGYLPWSKRLTIKKEEVTKVDASLFPAAPSFTPVTFTGALKPLLSPDGTKIVYGIPKIDATTDTKKTGIYVLDLGSLPIGFSSDPKLVSSLNPETSTWYWSPDSRELLITTANGVFIIPSGSFTPDNELINISGQKLEKSIAEWKTEKKKMQESVISYLPRSLQDIFNRKSRAISISPDENKILYIASGSATIADNQIPQIPGSSTQQQTRVLKDSQTYVYDIKEDRNFLISEKNLILSDEFTTPATSSGIINTKNVNLQATAGWFPTSSQVILTDTNAVAIMDYDGTNKQIVWSGPYELPYVFPSPNGNRLLFLTKLGAGTITTPNLYSLNLK